MGSRTKIIAALAIALAFCAFTASANIIITFDQGLGSGTLDHTAGGVVTGSGIGFDDVIVTGTGANDGTYVCIACELNFTSGALNTEGPTNWSWAPGGSFSITGTVVGLPEGTGMASGILAEGSFDGGITATSFGSRISLLGLGFDTKNDDLEVGLGLLPTTEWSHAATAIDVDSTIMGDGSFSGSVDEADLANIAVPIPATPLLMLLGAAAIAARRRQS